MGISDEPAEEPEGIGKGATTGSLEEDFEDLEDESDHPRLDDPTQYSDAEDKMTPNAVLIAFLQCLLHLIEGSKFEAVHNRIQLKAEWGMTDTMHIPMV
jgi:hypothetical protein